MKRVLHSVGRALERWGGMLVAPRATVRRFRGDEGAYDDVWLIVLYLVGTQVWSLARAIAKGIAVDNGLFVLLIEIGQALVLPLATTVLVDIALGSAKTHARGACLVPLVAFGTIGHLGMQLRWWQPSPDWIPQAVGAAVAVAVGWWIRPSVEPKRAQEPAKESESA